MHSTPINRTPNFVIGLNKITSFLTTAVLFKRGKGRAPYLRLCDALFSGVPVFSATYA